MYNTCHTLREDLVSIVALEAAWVRNGCLRTVLPGVLYFCLRKALEWKVSWKFFFLNNAEVFPEGVTCTATHCQCLENCSNKHGTQHLSLLCRVCPLSTWCSYICATVICTCPVKFCLKLILQVVIHETTLHSSGRVKRRVVCQPSLFYRLSVSTTSCGCWGEPMSWKCPLFVSCLCLFIM